MTEIKNKLEIKKEDLLCATLDIRCRKFKELQKWYRVIYNTPKELLKVFILELDFNVTETEIASSSSDEEVDDIFQDIEDETPRQKRQIIIEKEIDNFLTVLEKTDSILTWWRKNQSTYTYLARVAKDFLPLSNFNILKISSTQAMSIN